MITKLVIEKEQSVCCVEMVMGSGADGCRSCGKGRVECQLRPDDLGVVNTAEYNRMDNSRTLYCI